MCDVTITDRALILSREPWRESDKRVCFFTEHHGKIVAVAIGARKIKSKLSGHLEPLRVAHVMLARGKMIDKIAQAVSMELFVAEPFERARIFLQGQLCCVIERGTEERHSDQELFELVCNGLRELQIAESHLLEYVCAQHLFLLAQHLGYAPEFSRCVVCGRESELTRFSPALGGLVCRVCPTPGGDLVYVSRQDHFFSCMSGFLHWRGLL